MKVPSLVIIFVLLLTGCATPLSREADGASLAAIAGVPADSIEYVTYCEFAEASGAGRYLEFVQGVLVVARDGVHLLGGNLREQSARHEIRLQNSELKGIDLRRFGRGRQVQLWTADRLLIVQVTPNKAAEDAEASAAVFEKIASHGVPKRTGDKFYLHRAPAILFIPR